MRILITNNTLAHRSGTELYVRDLALALVRRGHFPVAYSTVLGEVAEELRRATVPVIDDLAALNEAPDLIHGQHHLETMTALLHFPDTPAIHVCHGWLPWEERPPLFPSIRRYVAVDDLCRERLLTTPGLPADRVEVLYNFVDTERFHRRGPLPERPQSALIFTNSALGDPALEAIRAGCRRAGIERVDVAGMAAGNPVAAPEQVLGGYDVVFAKARCALEAMACGCAVVLSDRAGLGGYVSMHNVAELRRLNFGVRTLQAAPVTEAAVLRELGRYDAADAGRVTSFIRVQADLASAVQRWLAVYQAVLAEGPRRPVAASVELAAAADYLAGLAPVLKARHAAELRAQQAGVDLACVADRLAQCEAELAASRAAAIRPDAVAVPAATPYQRLRAWLAGS
jgi:hypothetical protein